MKLFTQNVDLFSRMLVPVIVLALSVATASAADTTWQHDPASPGDWYDPANWTNGAPGIGIYPHIRNGGTAVISYGVVYDVGDIGNGGVVLSGSASMRITWIQLFAPGGGASCSFTMSDSAYLQTVQIEVGNPGSKFIQEGGTIYNGHLYVSPGGSFELKGGQIKSEHLGVAGGTFTQTGGYYDLYRIEIAAGGTYRLAEGQVDVYSEILLRASGSRFVQEGGTASVGRSYADSSAGCATMTFSGGQFSAGEFDVGDHETDQGLNLEITNPAASVSAGTLRLLRLSNFSAVAGSHIKLTGQLINQSTDSAALAGLANLNLIVQGGSGWFVPVEAAGTDLGAVAAGWTENFALAALTLGDTSAGKVRLVNGFDNQPGFSGADALYVDNLVLNPGAAVDLNGLNLYYRNGGAAKRFFLGDAFLDGDVDFADYQALEAHHGATSGAVWADGDFNGDRDVDFADYQLLEVNFGWQTPEPGSLAMLTVGLAVITRRGRRRWRSKCCQSRRGDRDAPRGRGP